MCVYRFLMTQENIFRTPRRHRRAHTMPWFIYSFHFLFASWVQVQTSSTLAGAFIWVRLRFPPLTNHSRLCLEAQLAPQSFCYFDITQASCRQKGFTIFEGLQKSVFRGTAVADTQCSIYQLALNPTSRASDATTTCRVMSV